MDELTPGLQEAVEFLDQQIERINKRLAKYQPLIDERAKLQAAKRALLASRSTTGGAGNPRTRLSMEEVVTALKGGGMSAIDLAEKLGMDDNTVRSHLNRYRDTRYTQDNGIWYLTEEQEEDE